MGGLISAAVAAVTAALVGLLIVGAASAASAAAADHARTVKLQAQRASLATDQTSAELSAYRGRLQQAYGQLEQTYQTLLARDAGYRQQLAQTSASARQLAAANKADVAKLTAAYDQVRQASAQMQNLQTSYRAQMQNLQTSYRAQLQLASQRLAQSQAAPAPAVSVVRRFRRDSGSGDD
ncbi:MAG: hypothetical protein ACYDAG_09665 [Chloroflexota bacterium]